MDKKEKSTKKKVEEEKQKESEKNSEDRGGFPDEIDFKKFLGCGG